MSPSSFSPRTYEGSRPVRSQSQYFRQQASTDEPSSSVRRFATSSNLSSDIGAEYIPDSLGRAPDRNQNQSQSQSQSQAIRSPKFEGYTSNLKLLLDLEHGAEVPKEQPKGKGQDTEESNSCMTASGNTQSTVTPRQMTPTHSGTTTPSGPPSGNYESDQYLPGLEFNISPEAAQSPTLGMSESEWKAIPFTTRRKLRAAIQGSVQSPPNDSSSAEGSLANSIALTSSARPMASAVPFTQRQRERSVSGAGSLSRSMSLNSGDSSVSSSPAFQFLSRFNPDPRQTSVGVSDSTNPGLGEQVGDFIIGKLIGYGGFSQVKEAHTIEDGKKVVRAVKIVPKYAPGSSPELMERLQSEFDHEVALWKKMDHPNVLKLLCIEETDRATYCFCDRITGGTLFDFVKTTRGDVDYNEVRKYIFEISNALQYLHETARIVHRDVKLENCLLEDQGDGTMKAVLCDFGMSEFLDKDNNGHQQGDEDNNNNNRHEDHIIGPSDTSSLFNQYHHYQHLKNLMGSSSSSSKDGASPSSPSVNKAPNSPSMGSATSSQNFGSLPYACPQLLLSGVPFIHPSVDIWSLGIVIFSLYMGHLPWNHTFLPKLRMMILEGNWDRQGLRAKAGEAVANLVSGCLAKKTEDRFTIRQVIEHEFCNNLSNEL